MVIDALARMWAGSLRVPTSDDEAMPSYLVCGEREGPRWRRLPFDRYPAVGDTFLTIGRGLGHEIVNGDGTGRVKRLLAVNTALFFPAYLRGGEEGPCAIGTLDWIDGWTLEREIDPTAGPACGPWRSR